jgi:uncharacterized repeat protein (TIGR01451 family)
MSLALRGQAGDSLDHKTPLHARTHSETVTQPARQAASPFAKVEPGLLKRVVEGGSDAHHRFVVELSEQADLSSLTRSSGKADLQQRVVTQLRTTAKRTQAEILAFLRARQEGERVSSFQPFWIFNGLAVTADSDTLFALAGRPEVRIIRQDRWRRWVEPSFTPEERNAGDETGVEWNIARVRADLVWGALGIDGKGATVAIMDTGVDWQHPALQRQYRGYKPGGLVIHQGNWFCTTEEGYTYPVDGNSHGTHVAGLAVGGPDASGRVIGMAPGARWIAVKMLNDAGYGYDSWIHAAFEWIMAPDGNPALAPHVINGSWGITGGADATFVEDLRAIRAGGIVPVFAAGNDGPRASTVQSPGSYPDVITVGATDSGDDVASFSGRGPSPWDEVKPEVVAPGTEIRSSLPGGTYGQAKGTSMATPHVSGLVALLLQADPTLTVDGVEALITSSAVPLDGEVPNSNTGWGRVDAYQAVAVATGAGFVAGQVTAQPDRQPVPNAQVTVSDQQGQHEATVLADDSGRYLVPVPPGRYLLAVKAFGYAPQTSPIVSVQSARTTKADVSLSPLPTGALTGKIHDAESGTPVSASLWAVGTPSRTSSDPYTGQYSLVLPAGSYAVQVQQNGYRQQTFEDIKIVRDQTKGLDVTLVPAPTILLVDSGAWYYDSQAGYFEQALDDLDYGYDLWEIRDTSDGLPSVDNLASYDITIWSSPQDAPGLIGAGDTISDFLSMGGDLFLTGQDIAFWDSGLSGTTWHEYFGRFLKARAVEDDAGRADLVGVPGEFLEGLSLPINGADSAQNQRTPDAVAVLEPRYATMVGEYEDGGGAAIRASQCRPSRATAPYRAVHMASGLEGLGSRAGRAEAMNRVLTWLNTPPLEVAVELYPARQDKVWLLGETVTHTVELQNLGQSVDRFGFEVSPSAWPTSVWDGAFSQVLTQSVSLDACQTQTLGLMVIVPPDVQWNASDVVTLTARSLTQSARYAQARFHSKAPAPILLVDDHRWFDVLPKYQAALEANQLPFDIWRVVQSPFPDLGSPTLERLQRYSVVIWFTAYDWDQTLSPDDEARLATYLDGGGRLLLSSQDYLYTSGFTDFAQDYLGVAGFRENLTATLVMAADGSRVGDQLSTMDLQYPFQNWSDAVRPTPAAQFAFWGQHGQPVALTLAKPPWKSAFYAFPLEALSQEDMAAATGQALHWLAPLGDSSLTVDQPVASRGEQLAYTLRIHNGGAARLEKASLSNPLPRGTSYVEGSLVGPAAHEPTTDRITWSGAMAPGETVTIGYRLKLNDSLAAGTVVRNVAHLNDGSGLAIESVAMSRIDAPDLSGSVKVVSMQVARSNQVLTYTFTLKNNGLRTAQARLTDPIPLHTSYRSGSAAASSGIVTSSAEALSWEGSLHAGQVAAITAPVVISPPAASSYILNRASLVDGWGDLHTLETHTWVNAHVFLPLLYKNP